MVMNCHTSEITGESGLSMGGTASRFNPRNLLNAEETLTVRPLTGGEQGDSSSEILIQQEDSTPQKPVEDKAVINIVTTANCASSRVETD